MEQLLGRFFTGADNKEHYIEVTQPMGAGGGFHVFVDHFYFGQIVPSPEGWLSCIEGHILNSDDIGAIMDLVEEKHPIREHYS